MKRKPTRVRTNAATGPIPAPVATLVIGEFGISDLGAGKFWVANADGEGMETTAGKLAGALRKFFREEF